MKVRFRWRYIFFLMLIILLIFESASRPLVKSVAKYQATLKATGIINEAILGELETSGEIIKNAIRINYSDDGSVNFVVADSYVFSFVKEHISKSLISVFSSANNCRTEIPMGVFSGVAMFSGFGPGVPIEISLIGTPKSEISGELVTTGINQNIYRVVLKYSVDITALIPFYSVNTEVSDEIVLAEIIFTGDIPEVVVNK